MTSCTDYRPVGPCGFDSADLIDRKALLDGIDGLIELSGGLCDDALGGICRTHSEVLFDGFCEDDPRQLRAARALVEDQLAWDRKEP